MVKIVPGWVAEGTRSAGGIACVCACVSKREGEEGREGEINSL